MVNKYLHDINLYHIILIEINSNKNVSIIKMKVKSTQTNNHYNPLNTTVPDIKFFNKRMKILENIRKLHANAHINHKSNILSILANKKLKKLLRINKFNFSDSQFEIARSKRKDRRISLNNYKKHVPYSKRKIS